MFKLIATAALSLTLTSPTGVSEAEPQASRQSTVEVVTKSGTPDKPRSVNGRGRAACLIIEADHVVVKNFIVKNCDHTGITIVGDYVTVKNVTVKHNVIGVEVRSGADHAFIQKSRFIKNDRMGRNTECVSVETCDDDYGAQAITVWGDHTVIKHNRFARNVAASYDYGRDGASVEIFEGQHSTIAHNVAEEEIVFSELGGVQRKAAHNTFRHNALRSSVPGATFLVTRGGGYWGPVYGTKLVKNRSYLRGEHSTALYCDPDCGPSVLILKRNELVGAGAGWMKGARPKGVRNVYCGLYATDLLPSPTDRVKTLATVKAGYEELAAQCS